MKIRQIALVFFLGGLGVYILFGWSIVFPYANNRARAKFANELRQITALCKREKNRTTFIVCFKKQLEGRIKVVGMQPYVDALVHDFSDPIRIHCHDIAHSIGQLGAKYSTSPTDALVSCTNICGAGCYHGVVEEHLARGGALSRAVQTMCTTSSDPVIERTRWACFHGLGHGIGSLTGELSESLALCDEISEEDDKKNCDRGVFMELFQSSSFEHATLSMPEDIAGFCRSLWGVHADVCFGNAGLQEYIRSKDIPRAAAVCGVVPEGKQKDCLSLLGNTLYHELHGDVRRIVDECSKAGQLNWCLTGAIQEDVLTDPSASRGFTLCAHASVDFQQECYTYLGDRIEATHGEDQREALCQNVTKYQTACQGVSR